MSAAGSKAWRCCNCKTVLIADEEPERCSACKWGTSFAACGVVSPPAPAGGPRR